jgi:FixJ family two-component response regulator
MMPNMDGFELHALLAASGREVPTIFISGQNNQKNLDRAASTNCVAMLNKPCDASILQDTIIKAIAAYHVKTSVVNVNVTAMIQLCTGSWERHVPICPGLTLLGFVIHPGWQRLSRASSGR